MEAHQHGILTSTTLLTNAPGFADAVAHARACPRLGVGLHVNIVRGAPLSPPERIPSLLGADARFPGSAGIVLCRLWARRIRSADLNTEIDAQIETFKAALGTPTHMDSEKNLHAFPVFRDAILAAARRHGIAALRCPEERSSGAHAAFTQQLKGRVLRGAARRFRRALTSAGLRTTDAFCGIAVSGGGLTAAYLADTIRTLRAGTLEIMCHPGHVAPGEPQPMGHAYINATREAELQALRDPDLPPLLARLDIPLLHFGQLPDNA